MPTIDEIRRLNLTRLVAELGGNKKLAEKVGVSESQMGQWVNGAKESTTGKQRGMRLASCHRIEDAAGKPRGWLDSMHEAVGVEPSGAPSSIQVPPTLERALPVVLSRLAGLDEYTAGQVLEAMRAATRPAPPLERIERDLMQWLSAAPAETTSKHRAAA